MSRSVYANHSNNIELLERICVAQTVCRADLCNSARFNQVPGNAPALYTLTYVYYIR